MTNTSDTPLYNFLKEYASSGIVPFHMPGHKMGKGLSRILTDNPAALDITEVPGADNLHFPTGVVKQAQEFTAKAFGADRSFFFGERLNLRYLRNNFNYMQARRQPDRRPRLPQIGDPRDDAGKGKACVHNAGV